MIAAARERAKECDLVHEVELTTKQSILNFTGSDTRAVLKVTTALPTHVPTLRGILERVSLTAGSFKRLS